MISGKAITLPACGSRAESERGAVLLELAVVLTPLLLVGLGVFEFSNAFYKYHAMVNAVRDAARYASSRSDDICATTPAGAAARTDIANIALRTDATQQAGSGTIWSSGYQIKVECTAGVSNSNQYYRGPALVRSVIVTAEVPYSSLGFLGFLGLSSPTLVVSHEERILGGR